MTFPIISLGFPGGAVLKNPPANAGDARESWRSPEIGNVFLPEKFHGQRSLAGCSPRGREESEVTEHVTPSLALEMLVNFSWKFSVHIWAWYLLSLSLCLHTHTPRSLYVYNPWHGLWLYSVYLMELNKHKESALVTLYLSRWIGGESLKSRRTVGLETKETTFPKLPLPFTSHETLMSHLLSQWLVF